MAEAAPTRIKIRKGIIKIDSDDITLDEIKKHCETVPPNLPLTFVRRLKKRNKVFTPENEEKWIPSKSYVLSFVGEELPTKVLIYKVSHDVKPYVPRPLQCFNCYKFEHTNKYCKSKKICIRCSSEHEGECGATLPKCVNCEGIHQSIDSSCPMYIKYKKVYTLMAHENLSFSDAKKKVFEETEESTDEKENIEVFFNNLLKEVISQRKENLRKEASNLETEAVLDDDSESSSSETPDTAENSARTSAAGKKNNKKKKKKGKSKKRRNF